jgi:hypothetical protein
VSKRAHANLQCRAQAAASADLLQRAPLLPALLLQA